MSYGVVQMEGNAKISKANKQYGEKQKGLNDISSTWMHLFIAELFAFLPPARGPSWDK